MTIHVTYSNARASLASLLRRVTENLEVVIIQRRDGKNVAMIAEDELSSLMTTAHLLASPANAERLLTALERSRQGEPGIQVASIEEFAHQVGLDDQEA
ncbi:MAG: type II toxin-antitoxin system Phd/YefM family antitoxin [Chloroflexota bacterium]